MSNLLPVRALWHLTDDTTDALRVLERARCWRTIRGGDYACMPYCSKSSLSNAFGEIRMDSHKRHRDRGPGNPLNCQPGMTHGRRAVAIPRASRCTLLRTPLLQSSLLEVHRAALRREVSHLHSTHDIIGLRKQVPAPVFNVTNISSRDQSQFHLQARSMEDMYKDEKEPSHGRLTVALRGRAKKAKDCYTRQS